MHIRGAMHHGLTDSPAHATSNRMSTIKAVCVYCGSGPGANPRFVETARAFGRILAENRIRLVFGGGSIGLMGAIAMSVIDHGGSVTGIIPDFLTAREFMFQRAQEMVVTRDMHERKRLMFERADAFVALPGGIGTLEELVEQLTWAQLGRHKKPILIANIEKFWDPLCALLRAHEASCSSFEPALRWTRWWRSGSRTSCRGFVSVGKRVPEEAKR